MSLTLLTGGTRSGKSAHAERLARATGLPVRYVATADHGDASMAERIAVHAARRPPEWETIVAGDDLAAHVAPGRCVLIDGLGTWIAGVMCRAGADMGGMPRSAASDPTRSRVLAAVAALAHAARETVGQVIVVAEQAGSGLLPAEALARAWLDLLGEATQALAGAADSALLVAAGRALELPAGGDLLVAAGRALELPAGSQAAAAQGPRMHGDALVRPGDADHAVNVVAGGPPAWLRDALRAADVARYPDERAATAAVAARHGREPDEIVPCNGATEALWLLAPALRPRHAACVHPAFTEAEAALHAHGVRTTRVLRDPERCFALDPSAVPPDADLVVAGNPASPSGTLDPAAALLALRRPGRVVVVDEAFMDLVPGEPASLVRERLDDVVVVRSLTKALAVPGLRVGYAVAAPALAARLRAVRPPWSANVLALAALEAAARRPDAIAEIAERAAAERADLAARLAAIPGVRVWPSAANFCLVEVADGPAVVAALRERAIAVRPAASFPGLGPGHLRITARAPAANARLVEAIEEVVAACV
jgi:histidinol-phosphate/aromatic aminotransferase/cobyric acid decarboxylase-like protein/adenosyl cobinamide kinase/adenosyl cobinamide phosphate guanylyltransferase